MEEETSAWTKQRNEEGAAANWRFRTEDARIKLRRLYPILTVENAVVR